MNEGTKPEIDPGLRDDEAYAAGLELGRHVRRSRKVALLPQDIRENVDLVFALHAFYAHIRAGFVEGYMAESRALQS